MPAPRPAVRAALAATLVAVAVAAPPRPAGAQTLRTVESSRQLHDTATLDVHVQYGDGRLTLRPARERVLYAAELAYDPDRADPVLRYDSLGRRLEIGVRVHGGVSVRSRSERAGSLALELTPRAPIDLSLELGAVEGDLHLGGLTLDALSVSSGASETTIHFDSATVRPLRRVDLNAGAAGLRVLGLGNASPAVVKLSAGAGSVELDFGGRWTRDIDLDASFAMGGLTLRVPRDVGVRVEMSRFLTAFDHGGRMRRRGGAWVSDNWDRAPRRLRVTSSTAFGRLTLRLE